MQLKQRKRINNNVEKFDTGVEQLNPTGGGQINFAQMETDKYLSDVLKQAQKGIPSHLLPKSTYTPKSKLNFSNAGTMISQGIQFAQDIGTSFGDVSNENELMGDAGSTYAQGSGFGYQKQNAINEQEQYNKLRKENTANTLSTAASGAALGATIGSVVPGIGTAIGAVGGALIGGTVGWLGGDSRKRKLRQRMFNAQQQVVRNNNYYQSSAHSDYLQKNYLQKHGNTQDDMLYQADRGKDLRQFITI